MTSVSPVHNPGEPTARPRHPDTTAEVEETASNRTTRTTGLGGLILAIPNDDTVTKPEIDCARLRATLDVETGAAVAAALGSAATAGIETAIEIEIEVETGTGNADAAGTATATAHTRRLIAHDTATMTTNRAIGGPKQ